MKLKSLALLLASTMAGIAHAHTASAEDPEGVWLIEERQQCRSSIAKVCCVAGFFGCRPRVILRDNSNATRGTPIQRCGSANCAG